MEQINKTMTFSNIKDAVDYIVNQYWDSLPSEDRKYLRNAKREFNRNCISVKKMEDIVSKYGGEIKTIVKITF